MVLVVPPAPHVPAREISNLCLLVSSHRNILPIYSQRAYENIHVMRKAPGVTLLLINDPEDIRHVLQTAMDKYVRPLPVHRIFIPFGRKALFLSQGAEWKQKRRSLAPVFSPVKVGSLLPHFHASAEGLLSDLATGQHVNLSRCFRVATLDAVLRALFSMPDKAERDGMAALVADYFAGPGLPDLWDTLARKVRSFGFALRGRDRFHHAWFANVDRIIAKRRAVPLSGQHRDNSDLLDLLLTARDAETGDPLPPEDIRDHASSMIIAGYETTARLLFWASYLLALDGEEQAAVHRELAAYPPDRMHNLEDLQNWPRLRNVLLETLRLYPPGPHLPREAAEADQVAGVELRPGDQAWISPWVLHRHRKHWQNPTAFDPGRFQGKSNPWTSIPAYMPFGTGPRICIGASFAMAEAQILLGSLLARFKIRLAHDRPVLPVARLSIAPDHDPMFRLAQKP